MEKYMNIFFEGIRLLNPAQNLDVKSNLWILDGKIEYIGNELQKNEQTEVIDAANLVCSPGLYDMHVHFREPGFTHKEDLQSGCAAAANGGFTGVLLMPNTKPCTDDLTVVSYINEKTRGNLVDVDLSAAITLQREGKLLSPMLKLAEAGVKLFTDDGACITDSGSMRRAFDYAATKDLLLSQHCQDMSLTEDACVNESKLSYNLGLKGMPNIAEDIIISRDIMLAEHCGNRRYHVQHISTKGSVDLIREAKERGSRITAEVTPHHISLTEDVTSTYDTSFKMNPPLRQRADIEALIEGLKDGTIDCIVTDHAPHALVEKEVPFDTAPFGIIGLETSLGIILTKLYHTQLLDLNTIIEKMSVNPRAILGLDAIKIEENELANLIIFDPDAEWIPDLKNFKSKSENSPFVGIPLKGKPVYTINNKQCIKSIL
jgi:dihydroorotase